MTFSKGSSSGLMLQEVMELLLTSAGPDEVGTIHSRKYHGVLSVCKTV